MPETDNKRLYLFQVSSLLLKQPAMEMGKYWILLMLMLATGGKRAIKRPTTLAHFSFLVPEREILVKIKASVETVNFGKF
jgi:hypothetical protein